MPRRSDARRCVLQMLYLIDQNPDADVHWIRANLEKELPDEPLMDFAWQLFTAVRERRSEIDGRITSVAKNWRIDRMAPTDRNVIRMGICEMEVVGTPAAVVLNECIEMAREFGTDNSPAFVNGILDRFSGSQANSEIDSE
ncbi:MAG: transcription antitermination factor NusB [Planctomycetaceae bacterium]